MSMSMKKLRLFPGNDAWALDLPIPCSGYEATTQRACRQLKQPYSAQVGVRMAQSDFGILICQTRLMVAKRTGHIGTVLFVSWSSDRARLTKGNLQLGSWDIANGRVVLAMPIKIYGSVFWLNVWDTNTAKPLNTFKVAVTVAPGMDLGWKTPQCFLGHVIQKFDTATWSEIVDLVSHKIGSNQLIGSPLRHEGWVPRYVVFSVYHKAVPLTNTLSDLNWEPNSVALWSTQGNRPIRIKHRVARAADGQGQRASLYVFFQFISSMLRSQHGSNIELREPPMVKVPWTAGKPLRFFPQEPSRKMEINR
ncbi:hypothetical protein BDR05DRAFT_998866 [Suillus weaverae]|nr:hypothetical protein BDR05DRAFT_998866 [Suillus weaverae]